MISTMFNIRCDISVKFRWNLTEEYQMQVGEGFCKVNTKSLSVSVLFFFPTLHAHMHDKEIAPSPAPFARHSSTWRTVKQRGAYTSDVCRPFCGRREGRRKERTLSMLRARHLISSGPLERNSSARRDTIVGKSRDVLRVPVYAM